jgi:hypothetical protein
VYNIGFLEWVLRTDELTRFDLGLPI